MRPLAFGIRPPLLGLLLAAAACGTPTSDTGGTVATAVQRQTSPNPGVNDVGTLVNDNTAFAFGLYNKLPAPDSGNLFYSPYSVSLALAMAYNGARGPTATEMAAALHFSLPIAALNPAFDALDLTIERKPVAATGSNGNPFALRLADSFWGAESIAFSQPFVDALAQYYGAEVHTVDFAGDPNGAESAINKWVADETNQRINPLLGPDAVDASTSLVLVNAVYFNASWGTQFEKTATQPGTFTLPSGKPVQTPLMSSGKVASAYAKGTNWQAVELPYSGGTTSMVVVLPDVGADDAIARGLSEDLYTTVTSALAYPDGGIDLTLPRFEIHGSTIHLKPPLKALGMNLAFDAGQADLTGMIPGKRSWIADVLHQAFVAVDETGTEAAAATAVVVETLAIAAPRPTPVTVVVDHPFYFFIRDIGTGTVLFMGHEADPTAQ